MKRKISFVLAITLLFPLFVIPASAISTNVIGMTYYNTILVTVEVETRTDFDTYNFGEYITDVCVVGMEAKELAVEYKLILKVSDANEDMIATVIEDISEIPIVKSVTRNNLLYRDNIVELNH